MIRNNSDLPIPDVRAAFHRVEEPIKGLGWTPVAAGTSLEPIRVLPPHTERHLPIAPGTAAQDPQADAVQAAVLGLQAEDLRESLDERKREAERRRRGQASMIFLIQFNFTGRKGGASWGPKPPSASMAARNSSDQPIYGAELRWYCGSAGWGEPNPKPLGMIPPGAGTDRTREFEAGTNMDVSGAVLRFTDVGGVRWRCLADGYLAEEP